MMNWKVLTGCFLCGFSYAQKINDIGSVDFKNAYGKLRLSYERKEISGDATYDVSLKKKVDTLYLDAVKMEITQVRWNGKPVNFANDGRQIKLFEKLKKGNHKLEFTYKAHPAQALYFVQAPNHHQIWSQGQGKYTSHWFPSIDDVNDKMVFALEVAFNKEYTVISNGTLKSVKEQGDIKHWHYSMNQPMSSYLLMLAIGKFNHQSVTSQGGITSELYLEPEEMSTHFEPTYRYSKEIFDYFEREIGRFPWEVYRQIPVRDFLYGGMENTTATIFTRDYVVDEIGFNDRNYVNVNAHELAHQWFGDCITASSGTHHWLQEGFATYYALLAEKEVFGANYFYYKLYENAEMLQKASKSDTIPILNPKASSLSFYQKGAWALHDLREQVGEKNFQKAVQNYLKAYAYKNVTTEDFLNEVFKIHPFNKEQFYATWLNNPGFPIQRALELLQKNAFMQEFFRLGEMQNLEFNEKEAQLLDILKSEAYFPIKQEVVFQTLPLDYDQKKQVLITAMQSGWEVRQAVAQSLRKIPEDFRESYETLLEDPSYLTREIALNALCRDFPDHRKRYLDKTEKQIGLNDKNIRLLWLTLALKTPDYRRDEKPAFYDELIAYAQPGNEASVRQNALKKLLFLDKADSNILPLLSKALVHHKWQLTKFARDTIREKLKLPNHLEFFKNHLKTLQGEEYNQLKRLLDAL